MQVPISKSFAGRYAAVDQDRLRRLQTESFVFDFSPYGEPLTPTARNTQLLTSLLEKNVSVQRILRSLWNDRLRELAASGEVRQRMAQVWGLSGVKAIQLTLGAFELEPSDWDVVVRDLAHWARRVRVSDDMSICTTAEELENAFVAGKIGLLQGLQDAAPIGGNLERIDTLYNFGVRVVQLTYNSRNLLGDGCTEPQQSGLSRFGVEIVRRLNEQGIIIDVSHCGYATTMNAIEISRRPVAVTHSSCQAIAAHPRAKSDEQLRALRDHDGYFGALCISSFIAPDGGANLETFLRHIEHAANIVGLERVGIGTDGCDGPSDFPRELHELTYAQFLSLGFNPSDLSPNGEAIPEFAAWEQWPNLTRGLMANGFSDDEIRGLVGGNWLKFMRRCGQ